MRERAKTGVATLETSYFDPAAAAICFVGAIGAAIIANRTHAFAPLCGLQGAAHCPACYVAAAMAGFTILFAVRWRTRQN